MRLDRIRSLARSGPGSSEAQDESWRAWRFGNITLEILFHQLLKDSSLMLNLLQCHIVFFLIERLTQPQVSAKIARKLGCRGALGGAPCLLV
jgi:hypothetical protein